MKRTLFMLTLFGAILALFSSSALAISFGGKELDTEKAAVALARDTPKGGYGLVTTEELKAWLDKKEPMLIIDTMPFEDSYKKQHIPGAVNFVFPVEEMNTLDDKTKAAFEKLLGADKNRKIVVYCGFTTCRRSHNGAMWAKKLGYTNVFRYPGGIKAWDEADYPVEKAN